MKIEHDVDKIYLTLGRSELLIHVPFRVVFEKVAEKSKDGKFFPVALTKREEQVLKGILGGKGNKEIASDLKLAERTVKFHVSSLLLKNKVGSRLELQVVYANAGGERK
jgi:DNA-binding NarL/FixJ family response regulator